jgi:hypothetical protein
VPAGATTTDAPAFAAPPTVGPTPLAPTESLPASIRAAAAAAGLMPFERPKDAEANDLLQLGSNPATAARVLPTARTNAAIAAAKPVPAKSGHGGGQSPPTAPPGSAGAGGGGGGFGGAATGMWCTDVQAFALIPLPELRPHDCRLVTAVPAGVTSLLQRPG